MKIISFNVNSVRIRLHQLQTVIDEHAPDFIGLQETKATDEDFPLEAIEAMGYQAAFHGQKTHYGVALLSRHPFKKIIKGFPEDEKDAQCRFIGGEFESPLGGTLTVFNGYFPQGESANHPKKFPAKKKYYEDLQNLLQSQYRPQDQIILMGDMNISHQDIDIGIGEDNRKRWLRDKKCSFLPEEREWLERLFNWGFEDTFRKHFPEQDNAFSWFDYRSKGFDRDPPRGLRIDLILATKALQERCNSAGISTSVRGMERPSDHCPIWAEFS